MTLCFTSTLSCSSRNTEIRCARSRISSPLALAILAVVSTLFLATDVNGSGTRIWLRIGRFSIQPGEVLRIALVAFIATYLSERGRILGASPARLGRLTVPPAAYWLPLLAGPIAYGLFRLRSGKRADPVTGGEPAKGQ